MIAEFIGSNDARWENFLANVQYDFYHLPEYVRFAAEYEGGEPIAFYAQDGESACLIPLLRRPLPASLEAPEGWTDVCSPYGYPSPLLFPAGKASLEQFLPALLELGRQEGVVSSFLRLHPLLPLALEKIDGVGELVLHGDTVVIDLTQSCEEFWRQTRKNHRSGINKLLRGGFEAVINDWQSFDEFKIIYRQTMARVEAAEYYHFSDAYFAGLRNALQEKLNLCAILAPTGEVAAAGLFTTCNGLIEFHLAGTSEKYFDWAPTKLMFDFVRRWGKDLGNQLFHLGGGVGGEADPLYHFKAGFSAQRRPFHTLRLIQDRSLYRELCTKIGNFSGECERGGESFFPCYRQTGTSG